MDAGSRPYARLVVLVGVLIAQLALALYGVDPPWRIDWFDFMQRTLPRAAWENPADSPVRIVAVQEREGAEDDQAIWPRDRLARLVDQIGQSGAKVIGLDMMLDGLGVFEVAEAQSGSVAGPDKTIYFGEVIEQWPVVAPVVLFHQEGLATLYARRNPSADDDAYEPRKADVAGIRSVNQLLDLAPSMSGEVRAHPAIARAARTEGLIMDQFGGLSETRALPMVRITDADTPDSVQYYSMPAEMVRLARGGEPIRLTEHAFGTVYMEVAPETTVPLDRRGDLRLNLRRPDPRIYIDGEDVFRGRFDPEFFRDKYVIVGLSLGDFSGLTGTPLFENAMSSEILAQTIEQIETGDYALRPGVIIWLEMALTLIVGIAIIWILPRMTPTVAIPSTLVVSLLAMPLSLAVYSQSGLMIDGLGMTAGLLIVGTVVFGSTLIDRDRQHQEVQLALLQERAAKSRLEGELDVARRIQMGLLPQAEAQPDPALEIACHIAPARMVGGDFYDHIVRSDGNVFFMIADVSGKGVPASLFMALSKSLWKSAALRMYDLDEIQALADSEISRDNKDQMFVTGVACLFDPRTGALSYTGAGHDMPVLATEQGVETVPEASGPPLGLGSAQSYPVGQVRLAPGDILCLFTDGVSESELVRQHDGSPLPAGSDAFFGAEGVIAALASARAAGASAAEALGSILQLLDHVTDGAEQADDRTLVVVRALGPVSNP
jgi:serine phosphatase RsbU (regulator of sigma subunit)